MTIRLAIFDFDGTLADTYAVFASSLSALAIKHGFRQVAREEQHKLRSMSAVEVLRELRLPLWKVPAVLSDFRKIMRQRIDEIRLFPGVTDVLHAMMRERIDLAVATSNSIENVKTVLGDTLINRFAAVECGATLFGKSHRLRQILKRTQADKAETLYVGDEIRDAEAAARVGVSFGAVAWGYTDLDALLRTSPSSVFHTPTDLLCLNRSEIDHATQDTPITFR
ncbi:HAD hydrolase-like protein [Burkholderia pseudomallei]|uniref:HAD hydrolase-like protein n=1 Tax=Burkholderia pseudomallei TaxID=28450 RepID=UPI00111E54C6|nr:HAD hydrolase-like protein [Burkholderia pseudomallei]MBO2969088.1 HAD hydrolase-like protein [Burkholderia pseudomallei]TOZ98153.1 haloacid dehalogenase [Burkholderia pseudomallei]